MGQLTLIRHTLRSLNNVWCECVFVGVCVRGGVRVWVGVMYMYECVCLHGIDFVVAVNINVFIQQIVIVSSPHYLLIRTPPT